MTTGQTLRKTGKLGAMQPNLATTLDLENRWPELFVGLDDGQSARVVHGWAAQWHEGWEPNRAAVELSVGYIAGRVSGDEYRRRVLAGIPASSLA